jgi:hypothetical protein
MKIFENDTDMSFLNGSIGAVAPAAAFGKTASAVLPQRGICLKALLMQVFQTAASVLSHRLPHSAKPHPRFCLSEV